MGNQPAERERLQPPLAHPKGISWKAAVCAEGSPSTEILQEGVKDSLGPYKSRKGSSRPGMC